MARTDGLKLRHILAQQIPIRTPMSEHHQHDGGCDHRHNASASERALHRDWRIWAAVGIMLVAMAIYLMTLGDVGDQPLPASNPPATAPSNPQ